MNADLLTDDLKKKRASNESFWLIGQPDVELRAHRKGEDKGKCAVEVHGFDYYNTKTGGIESGGERADRRLAARHRLRRPQPLPAPGVLPDGRREGGLGAAGPNLKAEIDEDLIEAYRGTVSLPFEPGEHKRIAVKIVDDRGIESLKVMEVE
jgi:adenine-specific DNA-methyltransferase